MKDFQVLVAEDDSSDAFLLQRAFSKISAKVVLHFVRDGQEAIDYLTGIGRFVDRTLYPMPTVVVADLKMPRMNGFDVLAWIRSQQILKRLPVVVFTSSDMLSDVNKAYDLGANSYLVKPSDAEGLQKIVKSLEQYWCELNRQPSTLAA